MDSPRGEYAYVGFADGVRRRSGPGMIRQMPWSAAGKPPSTAASSEITRWCVDLRRMSDRTVESEPGRRQRQCGAAHAQVDGPADPVRLQLAGRRHWRQIYNAEDSKTYSAEITFSGNVS